MADRFARSRNLLKRARKVIPGGLWGAVRQPSFLDAGQYPVFAVRAEGARFMDVDGNWFIDYVCGDGAVVSGHANLVVDEAVVFAARQGECMSLGTELSVEVAEKLVGQVSGMDWCAWGRTAAESIAVAVQVARSHTLRRLVVAFEGDVDVPDSLVALRCPFNDVHALAQLFRERPKEIAAVVVPPVLLAPGRPCRGASPELLSEARRLSRDTGALLIMNELRTAFRVGLKGCHERLGVEVDLTCMGPAVANGWPLSVVMGAGHLAKAAAQVPLAEELVVGASALSAAAANVRLLVENDGVARMERLGARLCEGLVRLGKRHDVLLEVSGPHALPMITIADDPSGRAMGWFAKEMVALGTFVHPRRNWFLTTAHTEAHIEETLHHADRVLGFLARARRAFEPGAP